MWLLLSPSKFVLGIKSRGFLGIVCFVITFLCIANPSVINSLAESFNSEIVAETITNGGSTNSINFGSQTGETSLTLAAFDGGSSLLSGNALPGGVVWDNATMLDSPYLPVTPRNAVDSDDNVHICWTNWYNGRTLYHQILFADGNWSEKTVLVNKSDGVSITVDIFADDSGRVHLAYSWGLTISAQKTYYAYWEDNIWSSFERVDFGEDELGESMPASNPLIRVSSDGTPHIVWSGEVFYLDEGLDFHPIYYQKRLAPGVWSNVLWSGYSRPETFSFLITKDDYCYVGTSIKGGGNYYANHHINILRKGPTDNNWLTNDEIARYDMPDHLRVVPNVALLEVGDTIHCFAVYLNEINPMIIDFTSAGVLWNDVELVTTDVGIENRIQLSATVINDSDIALVYNWHYYDTGTLQSGVFYKMFYEDNQEWSETMPVSANHSRAIVPYISHDTKDNLHVTWGDDHPESGKAVYYSHGISDKDLDGLSNYDERMIYFTDPNDPDSDDDLLNDGDEIALGMDPLNPDEDSDLMLDGWEINYGLDPFNATDATIDQDTDGLTNLEEFNAQTDPTNDDTDGDALLDGDEVYGIHSPINPGANATGWILGLDPTNPDTDDDELFDGVEITIWTTNPLNNDTDSDGMHDGFETQYGLDPLVDDAGGDLDGEGLTNYEEYVLGTNPANNDTDSDNLTDFEEVITYLTDPLDEDTDDDLLTDYYEIVFDPFDDLYLTNNTYQTNPLLADTDSDFLSDLFELNVSLTNPIVNDTDADQMLDGYEWEYGLDPFTNDAAEDYDSDGLTNYIESLYWSNPFDEDTDGDNLLDAEEVEYGTSLISDDTDGDLLTDYLEIIHYFTDPLDPDTDDDLLNDFYEVVYYLTNPFNNDTDGDTLLDGYEVFTIGSSPVNKDTDDDGLDDNLEIDFNSSPLLPDTDFDGMDDFWEWTYGFNPQYNDGGGDADGDGLTNYEEFRFFAHPHMNDTDGDLLNDYEEVYVFLTYPFDNDTDNDFLSDYDEIYTYFTNAHDPDTDDDSLLDGEEIFIYLTDPLLYDTDSDGYSDSEEILAGTDPFDPRSNPKARQITLIVTIFSSIIGIILIYFFAPILFAKGSGKSERKWIRIGHKRRLEKSDQLLKVLEKEIPDPDIEKS